jgi:ribosome biogenesis GTPase / thiamine phosphate phosphatase
LSLQDIDSTLGRLGWDERREAEFGAHRGAGLAPARVAVQHRGAYDLVHSGGELRATAATRLARAGELPAVGDWVGVDHATGRIEAVLERRTVISRKETLAVTREQVLAANVDVAFIAQALPADFNVRRLERYLAMAWESGAQPVVLLTKSDLVADVSPFVDEAGAAAVGACPVCAVSARTGEGLEALRRWFEGNRTAVLLGSSGVGKSTLVNALAGNERLATAEVREGDQRGRHTTTRRELIVLPGGGVVLDTPGIRELRLWDADLEQAFGDVEELVLRCRFADCGHGSEPGCAVREALAAGVLPHGRWQSYLKLQRELEALEARRDHRLRQQRVRQYKILERANRRRRKH